MEGLASNFESVLEHFAEHLQGAMYAAIDMELTGTGFDKRPDSYEETAAERLSKMCEVAESHEPIQIGITLVKHDNNCFQCSSYSFYAFPWVGPELLGQDRSFLCRSSAMQFNADKDHVDFNKWLKQAVPYMSREDEARYLASPLSHGDSDLPRKTGLLRLWKLLCDARVPLVTHCPLDIFFLLACFERRQLPRDPSQMAKLVSDCLPCIFDTAHLHGAIGGFKSLQLVRLLQDAKAKHSELAASGMVLPCLFELEHQTALRYGSGADMAHDAGFDSLCTAQLYAYLLNLSPEKVGESVNRLFLFKSVEYLDLGRAAEDFEPGSSMFDLSWQSLMVASLCQPGDARALQQISRAGFVYKRMDSSHVLVTVPMESRRNSQAGKFNLAIPGVQWLPFTEWFQEARARTAGHRSTGFHMPGPSLQHSDSHACQTMKKVEEAMLQHTSASSMSKLVAASTASSNKDANAKSHSCGSIMSKLSAATTASSNKHNSMNSHIFSCNKSEVGIGSTVAPCPTSSFVPCSNTQAWLGDGAMPRYRGVVKKINASSGSGFIRCPETYARFKRDVFVHHSQSAAIASLHVGQEVWFTVTSNRRGQPQARELLAANASSWLASSLDPFEVDADEGRTTIGESSYCGSTSDLDSTMEDTCSSGDSKPTLASLIWLGGIDA